MRFVKEDRFTCVLMEETLPLITVSTAADDFFLLLFFSPSGARGSTLLTDDKDMDMGGQLKGGVELIPLLDVVMVTPDDGGC